ncbi:MAG: iron ABC transporter permease [Paracoccaceae bacterium]
MTKQNSQTPQVLPKKADFDRWLITAAIIALLVVSPIVSVIWIALTPSENIWPHLVATVLPRYAQNTVILVVCVGALAATVGMLTAWMVTMYRFPGSKLLQWLLLLPLAIPAYVGAYALVDFLEYAGPVQTSLRGMFGWQTSRDYMFPEIRSLWAAVVVLTAALYPYVFLLVRSALREQSAGTYEVARALGAGPVKRLLFVGLPLARPAIAAGAAIVMMETVSDFGVVTHFSIQTLTTGIFSAWLEGGNRGAAAQIASLVLMVALILLVVEKNGRRKSRYYQLSGPKRVIVPLTLSGWRGWVATGLCLIPFVIGFLVPFLVIANHALKNTSQWIDPDLLQAFINTVFVGVVAAIATVIGALLMVFSIRQYGRRISTFLMPVAAIGYAAPGAVIAVGILIPLAAIDHGIADLVEKYFDVDIGLLMTGSAFAVGFSYFIRFFAISMGAADAALGRIAPSLPMAARSLGKTQAQTLRQVHFPLIRASIGTAFLLVFIDCVKELPATLLLRPFNFNTLSTRVYEKASLELIGEASPAALLVIGVGLLAVVLIVRADQRG